MKEWDTSRAEGKKRKRDDGGKGGKKIKVSEKGNVKQKSRCFQPHEPNLSAPPGRIDESQSDFKGDNPISVCDSSRVRDHRRIHRPPRIITKSD